MFLVDTSVWIDWLRGSSTLAVGWLRQILDRDYPFGIPSVVYQELLQGADSEAAFERLEAYFGSQRFVHPLDPVDSHREAARIYYRCRRAGVTVRSTVDCLIARIAVEHDLFLVHDDRDFDRMAAVVPELRLFAGSLAGDPSSEVHEPVARYDSGG